MPPIRAITSRPLGGPHPPVFARQEIPITRNHLLSAGFVTAWIGVISVGQFWLLGYQTNPGQSAKAADWPVESTLRPRDGHFTLVLFAHPHCPCTRASVEELSWVMAHSRGKLDVYAVFVLPKGAPADWERTPLWDMVATIPGLQPVSDVGGVEASRFRVETSGQTLLFDSLGALVCSGGITAGRGHAGDNAGRRALVECLAGRMPDRREIPVFGCPLFGDDRCDRDGNRECKP